MGEPNTHSVRAWSRFPKSFLSVKSRFVSPCRRSDADLQRSGLVVLSECRHVNHDTGDVCGHACRLQAGGCAGGTAVARRMRMQKATEKSSRSLRVKLTDGQHSNGSGRRLERSSTTQGTRENTSRQARSRESIGGVPPPAAFRQLRSAALFANRTQLLGELNQCVTSDD